MLWGGVGVGTLTVSAQTSLVGRRFNKHLLWGIGEEINYHC